jgi:hypothetical protein
MLKPQFKYNPLNLDEGDSVRLTSRSKFISNSVQIKGRWFRHEYNNPPKLSDLNPGDVFLMDSQLNLGPPHNLHPMVFMGKWNKGEIKIMKYRISTFRYKPLGSANVCVGIMVLKNIYIEVWP